MGFTTYTDLSNTILNIARGKIMVGDYKTHPASHNNRNYSKNRNELRYISPFYLFLAGNISLSHQEGQL